MAFYVKKLFHSIEPRAATFIIFLFFRQSNVMILSAGVLIEWKADIKAAAIFIISPFTTYSFSFAMLPPFPLAAIKLNTAIKESPLPSHSFVYSGFLVYPGNDKPLQHADY